MIITETCLLKKNHVTLFVESYKRQREYEESEVQETKKPYIFQEDEYN